MSDVTVVDGIIITGQRADPVTGAYPGVTTSGSSGPVISKRERDTGVILSTRAEGIRTFEDVTHYTINDEQSAAQGVAGRKVNPAAKTCPGDET